MALAMTDVELLDRVITGSPVVTAANLDGVRIGLVKDLLANTDKDTGAIFESSIEKLKGAGVEIVELEAPEILSLNGAWWHTWTNTKPGYP